MIDGKGSLRAGEVSWLGLRVVPVGFSGGCCPGRCCGPAGLGSSSPGARPLWPGLWFGGVPGLQLPAGGFGVPGPVGESFPQCGDVGPDEPYVGNLVSFIWSSRSPASAKSWPVRPGSSRRAPD